jgi:hypothetical protein
MGLAGHYRKYRRGSRPLCKFMSYLDMLNLRGLSFIEKKISSRQLEIWARR